MHHAQMSLGFHQSVGLSEQIADARQLP
jgi:hypothetical protein